MFKRFRFDGHGTLSVKVLEQLVREIPKNWYAKLVLNGQPRPYIVTDCPMSFLYEHLQTAKHVVWLEAQASKG